MLGTREIMVEFLDLMELVDKSDVDGIVRRIPDDAYRRNFLGLARRLAPDGGRIRQVGFTMIGNAGTRAVSVTASPSQFPPSEPTSPRASIIEVSGTLRYANASSNKRNQIKLVEQESGETHAINVPPGLMDDIVSPMWNTFVTVRGSLTGRQRNIRLQEIWQPDVGDGSSAGRRVVAGRDPRPHGMRFLL